MNVLKKWYSINFRFFRVISTKEANELGLTHKQNVYGDLINRLNCRSIWVDSKQRRYRVEELYPKRDE